MFQANAEIAVREMLREISAKSGREELYAEDFMDDGSKIALKIDIDHEKVKIIGFLLSGV